MEDEDAEAALVAMLARLSADDGPLAADTAIELYLDRFGGCEGQRRAALRRVTRLLLDRPEESVQAEPDNVASLRRRPN